MKQIASILFGFIAIFVSACSYANDSTARVTAQSAETCTMLPQSKLTLAQFEELQHFTSPNSVIKHNYVENGCSPQAKTSMILGSPVCKFNDVIPVIGIAPTTLKDNGSVEIVLYMMRGTKQDFENAVAFFNSKYIDITDEYLTKLKGPKFYSSIHAWKSNDQYIVLGQNEPGYDPVEISLQLLIGTKEGVEHAGIDLNTCKSR